MIFNYGSINIDYVYSVHDFVRAGETISSSMLETFAGGKGLNQSVSLGRAGAPVKHCGCASINAEFLIEILIKSGVDTSLIRRVEATNGHAIIQVSSSGQNSIILYGGTNLLLDSNYAQTIADEIRPDDMVLFQNEVSAIADMMRLAKNAGAKIVLNPSPMDEACLNLPLDIVDIFILNEVEGERIAGSGEPQVILKIMQERLGDVKIILTLGKNGAYFHYKGEQFFQDIVNVGNVVDTTAAGDTFTGFYLAGISEGSTDRQAMLQAAVASGIAVTRRGAAPSIPTKEEVNAFINATSIQI